MLVYFATAGPYAPLAEGVFARDPVWISSPLWRSEFRQAIAGSVRRGELSVEAAIAAFTGAERVLTQEITPTTDDVIRLLTTSRCSAYDLEFVALARSLGVPLVTNDRQVLAAFPRVAVAPDAFTSAP